MGELIERKKRILLNEPHIDTASGGVANFSTDLIAPLKSCKVEFLPVQASGTPSPSNPLPISGWNSVTVTRAGKNLFDLWARGYWSSATKTWVSSTAGAVSKPIPVRTGDVVTISQDNATATYQFIEWDKSVEQPSDYTADDCLAFVKSADGAPKTYTVQHDCYLCVFVNIGNDSFDSRHVQLEFGNGSTYSAYTGTTYPISWTDHGTVYGGYVDLASGTLVRTWGSYTISANTPFYKAGANRPDFLYINEAVGMLPFYSSADRWTGYCDMIKVITTRSRTQIETLFGTYEGGTFYDRIYIYDLNKTFTSITTSDEAIAKLKELAPTFVFPLQNVQTYQLTPQQIKTLRGTNNIWSNANGDITIKYWKH